MSLTSMVSEMTSPSSVTLITLDNSRTQVIDLLEDASIPYREDSSSNISGTTITQVVIPIAAIVVPVFVQIILALRDSSSRTIVRVNNLTINILGDDDVEQTLRNALEAVKSRHNSTTNRQTTQPPPLRPSQNNPNKNKRN
ncbi:MAG: hypothetical protein HC840_02200 [Leptolyngbyaceae cyanobacterium RM2_2_4]|nr:hypothetical protein [Leptolyngbyaceae cyanobacterium RM2_2_4]